MLKEVKKKVKTGSEAAKDIRTVREERNDQMLIVLSKKNKEGMEELKRQLKSDENMVMTTRDNGQRVTIKEIDSLTTAEELAQAIGEEVGIDPKEIKVGNFRPSYGGNKAVTISVVPRAAQKLIDKGRVRIGLNLCNIIDRVNVGNTIIGEER